jgi:transcriptional regulator with XRE-family HTH domain
MAARRSQMDLALDAKVSPRHLSCVERGIARPSATLLLRLADCLALPLRQRNDWLLAAGFAPRFSHGDYGTAPLAAVQRALARLLAAHEPNPGLVLDAQFNVLQANGVATRLLGLLPPALQGPPLNLLRASLHPEGFAAITSNFNAWGAHVLANARQRAAHGDPALRRLLDEVERYPTVRALPQPDANDEGAGLLLPCEMLLQGQKLRLFTTLARLDGARDVTLQELSIELFYPADEATEAALQAMR